MADRIRRRAVALLVAALVAATPAGGGEFSLQIGAALRSRSPAADARLARWETPMGRVEAAVAEAQSGLGFSGLVGRPVGLAFRVGLQRGRPPGVIAAAVRRGLDLAVERVLELGTEGGSPGAARGFSLGPRIDALFREARSTAPP